MKAINKFYSDFGDLIRHYRLLHGLTLEEVATHSGLDKARLSRMETASYRPPPLPILKKMARVFHISEKSAEFKDLVDLAMKSRVTGRGGLYTRKTLNPHRIWSLEEASHRLRDQIEAEGAELVDATLEIKDSNGSQWFLHVEIPEKKKEAASKNRGKK